MTLQTRFQLTGKMHVLYFWVRMRWSDWLGEFGYVLIGGSLHLVGRRCANRILSPFFFGM